MRGSVIGFFAGAALNNSAVRSTPLELNRRVVSDKHSMKLFTHTHKIIQQGGRLSRAAVLCFALVLLLAQTVSLAHAHDHDLTRHLDCELCLHIGGLDQALSSSGFSVALTHTHVESAALLVTHYSRSFVRPSSRAPPILS